MIIARYLARDILLTTFAVTFILLLVVFSGRLSAYIADAATGRLAADLVFPALLARIPEYLELVLPLAFFVGVLVALGQLQESNELTAGRAAGLGTGQLLAITLSCAAFVALVIALFAFFVTPRGGLYVNQLLADQGLQSELAVVTPGRFYEFDQGARTLYTTRLSDDREVMTGVFINETGQDDIGIMLARSGYQEFAENGGFYFVLEQGVRYQGMPGSTLFEVMDFERYAGLMSPPRPVNQRVDPERTLMLPQLIAGADPASRAELGWRISLPLMVLLLGVLAQPLSQSQPRQGRFMRLAPAIGLYLVYMLGLSAIRDEIRQGLPNGLLIYAGVHVAFLGLALFLLAYPLLRLKMARAR